MKRYIKNTREYNSSRAAEYQNRQAAKQIARTLQTQRYAYVKDIEDDLEAALESEIDSAIFEPALTPDVIDRWSDYHRSRYSKYYTEDEYASTDPVAHGAPVTIFAEPEYIEIHVGVFGSPGALTNTGLEWIADIETGGDGSICCNYVSKLPARMKRKFEEYKDIIAELIESHGFEILEAPKNDGRGFVFKVTNDDYDALTGVSYDR